MATELQRQGNRDWAPQRHHRPPKGTGAARPARRQPPPPTSPARRPEPGPAHLPRRPARPPSPGPIDKPAALIDLTSVVVVDLRLAEVPELELVGAPALSAGLPIQASASTGPQSSLPYSPVDDDAGGVVDSPAGLRPAHEVDRLELLADSSDRQVSYEPLDPGRQVWPEIRFYLGSTALFFIAFSLATGMWVLGPKLLLGWDSAAITSGSMEPAIHVGDVVVFSEPPAEPLARGAVIAFPDGQGSLVTHRVIGALDDGRYITRGDNNPATDSTPVRHDDVQGVGRLLVPFAGYPAVWTSSGSVFSVLAVAIGFGLLSFASRWAVLPRFNPWPGER